MTCAGLFLLSVVFATMLVKTAEGHVPSILPMPMDVGH